MPALLLSDRGGSTETPEMGQDEGGCRLGLFLGISLPFERVTQGTGSQSLETGPGVYSYPCDIGQAGALLCTPSLLI